MVFVEGNIAGCPVDFAGRSMNHPLHILLPANLQHIERPFHISPYIRLWGLIRIGNSNESSEMENNFDPLSCPAEAIPIPNISTDDLHLLLIGRTIYPAPT